MRAEICEGRGDLVGALAAYRRFHEPAAKAAKAAKQANSLRSKVIRSLLDTQQAEHDLALARNQDRERRIDSWIGIPVADRKVVFEPFERGEGAEHGTRSIGLGLAVTRDLAQLVGGDITYDHDGSESVFLLTLPGTG